MNHKYLPQTKQDIAEMLETIGVDSIEDLFHEIPKEVRLNREYALEPSKSEIEVMRHFEELKAKNSDSMIPFIGAGSYDHYIPTIIKHITSRSEFYTAYTPYQPEVSQGTLQYIFEFQTMITDLTNMDVTNASMYDGATSCAESIMMAVNQTRRTKVLVSNLVHPSTLATVKTYGHFYGFEVILLKDKNGVIDLDDLQAKLDDSIASVVVSNPNFLGNIEDVDAFVQKVHDQKSLLIMVVNPLSLGLLKTPGEYGADIACGDAQPLGLAMNFGGPYLGFICATKALLRKMPGRIVGETKDVDGKRAFVLTLQAREQHIRREKANSNICSNQSLNALASTVYMATLGKKGLVEVTDQNVQKAHYAFEQLKQLPKFSAVYETPFFNEFVLKTTVPYETIKNALLKEHMIAGLDLGCFYDTMKNHILFCVTEKRTKAEIDRLVHVLGGLN